MSGGCWNTSACGNVVTAQDVSHWLQPLPNALLINVLVNFDEFPSSLRSNLCSTFPDGINVSATLQIAQRCQDQPSVTNPEKAAPPKDRNCILLQCKKIHHQVPNGLSAGLAALETQIKVQYISTIALTSSLKTLR
jgi:hypothetical protein